MRVEQRCPVCGREVSCRIYGERGRLRLLVCPVCAFVFCDRGRWADPYRTGDYYERQPPEVYPLRIDATSRERVEAVRRFRPFGAWLDFGGGRGRTAVAAVRRGYEVTVVEASEAAVREGRRHHPEVRWIRSDRVPDELPRGAFDCITLFHVLEHVVEPVPLLRALVERLRPDGVLCIEVPDWGCLPRRLRGMRWTYVLDHHVNYFTERTLVRLAASCGLQRRRVERRRRFAVNEARPWREPVKRVLAALRMGNILRAFFHRPAAPVGDPAGPPR